MVGPRSYARRFDLKAVRIGCKKDFCGKALRVALYGDAEFFEFAVEGGAGEMKDLGTSSHIACGALECL